ncbi:MAG: phosphoribosylaminoimidazolesuccinocarboxamide synthase [Dissulfurispiraceae bacterium]|jgi:phosphoribosylaminoimidazole-succinocarboxamide synthase|nr:phosphoribosylaminoimidazolesuccinocarboxamide synthase [Dissulfurispiraceae bacterium]
MEQVITETNFESLSLLRRGKVRDVYDIDDKLLIVVTDRVSAFDVVLPNGIPGKGRVLNKISEYWFSQMKDIVENHIIATNPDQYPDAARRHKAVLEGRSMLVKKAEPLPVECIVRGYLSGSGWKEYQSNGTVCGIKLPEGLVDSSRLDDPIFTPSTKAEEGHDINISFEEMINIIGKDTAEQAKSIALRVYAKAREIAEKKGIIIADTKMEFGIFDGRLIIIDELLTPDSSRFWSAKDYAPGRPQDSFDKQIIRDYLLTLDWNKTYPGPALPQEIVDKTVARYNAILDILTK